MKHFTATAVVHGTDGRVLLVHHKKYGRWMCPGGHIEPDELPDDAVLREVWEETGLRVRFLPNGERTGIADGQAAVLHTPFCVLEERVDSQHFHIDLVYRCLAEAAPPHLNDRETHDVRWFHPSEIEGWGEDRTFPNVRAVILQSAALPLYGEA
jgi:8-oxo-dGTP pyrophosphatase MutT (NUDIX family)